MSRFFRWLDSSLNAFSPADAARLHLLLLAILTITLVGLFSLGWLWRYRGKPSGVSRAVALAGALPLVVGFACLLDAVFVEPRWLEVTRQRVQTEKLPAGRHVRIALLSDLHVDRWNRILRELPSLVNDEHPDLVLYAGDSVNAESGLPIFRSVLSSMHGTYGTFAVRGNHDLDLPQRGAELFSGGVASELQGRPVTVAGGQVVLCGAPWSFKGPALRECLDQSNEAALRIAVYHSPDLIEDAVLGGADLFVAGHTHGGQFRLPFYGAIITMSSFDKKYEAGRYLVGDTTLYVNRGIGVEARMIPLRFFCRPELTIIDVEGTGPTLAPHASAAP